MFVDANSVLDTVLLDEEVADEELEDVDEEDEEEEDEELVLSEVLEDEDDVCWALVDVDVFDDCWDEVVFCSELVDVVCEVCVVVVLASDVCLADVEVASTIHE